MATSDIGQTNRGSKITWRHPGQLTLLDTVIIFMISCSVLIFVFTVSSRFLGRDTFDKLPDFIKDSYTALWSAGAVAGGALVGAVVDALSKRERTKGSFLFAVIATTLLIMGLIVGTVELSRSLEGPQFSVPVGAKALKISNTYAPVAFYLQNKIGFGNPARIRGTYSIKDGLLTGEVSDSQIDPIRGPVGFSIKFDNLSVHLCYLGINNGFPILKYRPEFPTSEDQAKISASSDLKASYQISKFAFKFDVSSLENIGPPYLCAYVNPSDRGAPTLQLY